MAAGRSSRCGGNSPRRLQTKILQHCELCCRQLQMCLWWLCRPSSSSRPLWPMGNQVPRIEIRHHCLGNDGAAGVRASATWLMTVSRVMNVFSRMLWLGEGAGSLPVFRSMLSTSECSRLWSAACAQGLVITKREDITGLVGTRRRPCNIFLSRFVALGSSRPSLSRLRREACSGF